MIRGSAVPTMVWSIAVRSAASSRPVIVPINCGFVRRTRPEVTYTGSDVDMGAGSLAQFGFLVVSAFRRTAPVRLKRDTTRKDARESVRAYGRLMLQSPSLP